MNGIYLDHAATTPIHPEVVATMATFLATDFGNPSSIHSAGRQARHRLDDSRRQIAKTIGANEKELIFTSGGTEADNLAIIGTALQQQTFGKHIITTQIEHAAILDACKYLESIGFEVTYLPVNKDGIVSVDALVDALRPDTILVSVMMINNEVGSIQPIQAIGERLLSHPCCFHTDAVQAYGITDIDVNALQVDLLSITAHKINGPKGIGLLYKREQVKIKQRQFGGSQERLKRPGTENMPGIIGFEKAAVMVYGKENERSSYYHQLKALVISLLDEAAIDFTVNGAVTLTTPLILNISFKGTKVEQLLMNLDLAGVYVSSGSACTAGSIEASHVLTAMFGEEHERTTSAVRFSFGYDIDEAAIKETVRRVTEVVKRLRTLNE